jgi:hypothetical protein
MRGLLRWGPILVVLLWAPGVQAHPAPDPRDFEVRLLHDYSDDWGGHSVISDGHDLIALDVQEAYDAALGVDSLYFRLLMNGGYNSDTTKPELKDVLTFKAAGKPVTFDYRTTDNTKFSGTFDAVRGPAPVYKSDGTADGSRYAVTGVLRLTTLGVAAGAAISDFKVQGYAGTYTQAGQDIETEPPSEQTDHAKYVRASYTLAGPTQYVDLVVDPAKIAFEPGKQSTITLTLRSQLKETQTVNLSASLPAGLTGTFHPAATAELASKAETILHFYVDGSGSASSGPATIVVTSSLGGRETGTSQIDVAPPATSTAASSSSPSPAKKGESPAPAAFLTLLAIAAVLMRRGR